MFCEKAEHDCLFSFEGLVEWGILSTFAYGIGYVSTKTRTARCSMVSMAACVFCVAFSTERQ